MFSICSNSFKLFHFSQNFESFSGVGTMLALNSNYPYFSASVAPFFIPKFTLEPKFLSLVRITVRDVQVTSQRPNVQLGGS